MVNITNNPITQYYKSIPTRSGSINKCKISVLEFRLSALIGLFVYLFICLFSPTASAANLSNSHYGVEIEDIDTTPDKIQESQKKVTIEPEPIKPKTENVIESFPLTFTLSTDFIDFGILSPGNPVSRVFDLSILGDSIAYHVHAFEDRPLTGKNNEVLPDATCDDGSCSEIRESPWITNLTYGFGYRCEPSALNKDIFAQDCLEFREEGLFKQLADSSKKEQTQVIMAGRLYGKAKTAEITLKINSTVNQKPSSYSNNLTFIAVPNY